MDEKRTSSNTSTWLLYTCTSEVLVKFPGYSSHKTGLSYRAASSRPRRRRKLAEGAASMPRDAPPADDAAPLRLAAPTAACAGELHPLGQFRQSQSTGLAPPADTAASPSARPRPLPGRSNRRVRRAAWSDRTHALPRHQARAATPLKRVSDWVAVSSAPCLIPAARQTWRSAPPTEQPVMLRRISAPATMSL